MNNTFTLLGECRLFSDLYPWIHHICLSLSYACFSDSWVDAHSWSLTHSDSVNHQTCEPKNFERILSQNVPIITKPVSHICTLIICYRFILLCCCLLAVVCWLFGHIISNFNLFSPTKSARALFLYISQGKNNWSFLYNTVLVTKNNYKYYSHTQQYS